MTFIQLLAIVTAHGLKMQICSDSRKVRRGDVFVALEGVNVDGHDYIPEAVSNGAEYVVCSRPCDCGGAERIMVADTARAFGTLAQGRFGNPAMHLTNLAVTGTNGKTTVSYLVRSIIEASGAGCGLVGTIVYDTGNGRAMQAPLTTPDAMQVAELGFNMMEAGKEYMVIEASSHALSQNRLAGVSFTAAAFTNLTGDHLDYHGTADEYLAAKMKLFEEMPMHGTAVLNKQSPAAERIAEKARGRVLWYAIDEPADIAAYIETMDIDGTVYSLQFGQVMERVRTRMIGRHNVSNQLAAAGLCFAAGIGLSTVVEGLTSLEAVPGRLEAVEQGQTFKVLVDYAHTDDALKNVLSTLRQLCRGRLIAVFGCGGDRDKSKRPRMAKVAEELADFAVVTSDNPRTEDPQKIIADVMAGFTDAESKRVIVEADRKRAIELAIGMAAAGDIVLIAGKGHEDYQITGTERIHFDDREVARWALEQRS